MFISARTSCLRSFIRCSHKSHCIKMATFTSSTSSASLQPGSLVTHPSLYAQSSREELLARIAELERLYARQAQSLSNQQGTATAAVDNTAVASSSCSTLDQAQPSTTTTTTATTPSDGDQADTTVQSLSKAERKLLKKQARLASSAGQGESAASTSTSTSISTSNNGQLQQGDDFFARYGTRKIALRFCYEGWLYGGLALQNDEPPSGILPIRSSASTSTSTSTSTSPSPSSTNPLPTVEGVLLDALVAARLIKESEKRDLTSKLDFSRCGRTDRGVSAAGQVVSLYVRSQLGEEEGRLQPGWRAPEIPAIPASPELNANNSAETDEETRNRVEKEKKQRARAELPYMALLNRVLPSSIRILGWSPVSDDFDARFSCKHRHYKYFFTAPSSPSSSSGTSNGKRRASSASLNVEKMQEAASKLIGEHDFRNLCKVDATKQITNFYRYVMSATISPVKKRTRMASTLSEQEDEEIQESEGEEEEEMYVFDLKGSAFLYHQVRHIMAVLFHVGSGHEDPSVIDALVNTGYPNERPILKPSDSASQSTNQSKAGLEIVSSRPAYEMASDLPLVLWDCAYPEEAGLRWRQDEVSQEARLEDSKAYKDMKSLRTQVQIKESILSHFMRAYLETGRSSYHGDDAEKKTMQVEEGRIGRNKVGKTFEIHLGAGKVARAGKYTPLLQRPRSDPVEVVNERWASGQGKRRAERKAREQGKTEVDDEE